MTIRFATFNVENLFSRPRAMNLANINLGTEKLIAIAEMQKEMAKSVYDKPKIARLAKSAHGYFAVNKTRGKSPLSYKNRKYTVKAKGRDDWVGFIELKRDQFSHDSVKNTAAFLKSLKADIIGLCEAESLPTLRRFRTDFLSIKNQRYEFLIDGTDPRGIDVGVYSRYPLGNIRTNIHYKQPRKSHPLFPRDCMEVEIPLTHGKSLWIIQCHLKSKLGPNEGNDRREAQATRLAEIIKERYDLTKDFVIVSGDMNDTPESEPLEPLLRNPNLHDTLSVVNVPKDERWTYHYRGQFNQIDHVLVSSALKSKVKHAFVDRRGIADISKYTDGREKPLNGITSWRNAASDHGAVVVDLDLKAP